MRISFSKIFLILTVFLLAPVVMGQPGTEYMDSVTLIKPGRHINLYKFFDNGVKEIEYQANPDLFVKETKNSNLKDFGNFLMTQISGFGFNSSADGYWKVSGTIQCGDTIPFWTVFMFCGGRVEKERERVRDDDGSWSVETSRTNFFFWDDNAGGILIEGLDTIGNFLIDMDPDDDELYKKWAAVSFPANHDDTDATPPKNSIIVPANAQGRDYELLGKYRNRNFALIHNGANRKVWIFLDDLPVCVFQGDFDYAGVKKKYRNTPYILLNKNILAGERRELFRLAIMSRYMNEYLSTF